MKHIAWILAILALVGNAFVLRQLVNHPTVNGMTIEEHLLADREKDLRNRRRQEGEFIARNPAPGLILDCGSWSSRRKHTFGFYNCTWTDPKHAGGPAQLRPPETRPRPARTWHHDSQLAAGEWKIEAQTPPCDSVKNLQVIWPKEPGAPVTIECDLMPVPTK